MTLVAEGTRYDPTCEAHTRLADDRPAGDRRIGGDYRYLDLDWSLAKGQWSADQIVAPQMATSRESQMSASSRFIGAA